MKKELFVNEEAFQKAKQRGLLKLQRQSLLLMMFLILFFTVGFFVVRVLFQEGKPLINYSVMAILELILWGISIYLLWRGKRMGRILFSILSCVSLYAIYSFMQLYQIEFQDGIDRFICFLFITTYICKSIIFLICSIRLYQKPIHYIWMTYYKEGKEAQEYDQQLIQNILEMKDTQEVHKQSRRKINLRAKQNLRKYTVGLIGFVYGAIIVFYIFMFLLQFIAPFDKRGIEYVQRYIILASLFSALVFSLPAIAMFLHVRWSRLAFIIAWLLEIIKFSLNISSTIYTLLHQQYGYVSIISFFIIEILRYGILLRITLQFMRDPFLEAYWKQQKMKER